MNADRSLRALVSCAVLLLGSSCVVGATGQPPVTGAPGNAPTTAPPPGTPQVVGEDRPVSVTWQGVTQTPGCFFFSGPADLGRDTHLGVSARWVRNDTSVQLSFDAQTVFAGAVSGTAVSLQRQGSYVYGPLPWTTQERIEGTLQSGYFQGTYAYTECDTSGAQGCPDHCTIQATVVIR